jgi:hypothetical protein
VTCAQLSGFLAAAQPNLLALVYGYPRRAGARQGYQSTGQEISAHMTRSITKQLQALDTHEQQHAALAVSQAAKSLSGKRM